MELDERIICNKKKRKRKDKLIRLSSSIKENKRRKIEKVANLIVILVALAIMASQWSTANHHCISLIDTY